jgi:DNA-directed RNA polymerase specialized sigma24 family protein
VVSRWADHGLACGDCRIEQRFVTKRTAAAHARTGLLSREESGASGAVRVVWNEQRMARDEQFEQFLRTTEPGLRRALTGHLAPDAVADALAEAFAYAWEHWDRVMQLEHPTGYLFRVAQSKVRIRKQGFLPWSSPDAMPDVEPALVGALGGLSPAQSRAVWLVHACGWTYAETAEALHMSPSTVGSHVSRALGHLREQLGVAVDG